MLCLDELGSDRDDLGAVGVGAQQRGYGHVDARAERRVLVVDEHAVVRVVVGYARVAVEVLGADDQRFLLLALDGEQYLVADARYARLVVDVDDARRSSIVHAIFCLFVVVIVVVASLIIKNQINNQIMEAITS